METRPPECLGHRILTGNPVHRPPRMRSVGKLSSADSQLVVIGSSAGGIEALSTRRRQPAGGLPALRSSSPSTWIRGGPSHLAEILARHSSPADQGRRGHRGARGRRHLRRPVEPARRDRRRRAAPSARPRRARVAPSVDLLLETAATAFGPGLIGGDPDRHRQRRLGRRVARQAGRRCGRHREPGHRAVPVDAAVDLAVARSTRPPTSNSIGRVAARPARRRGGRPGRSRGPRVPRRCSSGSGSAAGSTSATYKTADDRPPAARPDERDRAHVRWPTTRSRLEIDPEEYARLISSLLIKVTEFFRDPKVFDHLRDQTLPMLIDDARRARSAAARLVGRLLDRRGGVLARDHAARGDRAEPASPSTCGSSRPTSTARRSRSPGAASTPPAALQNVPRPLRERYFVKSDGGYEVAKRLRALMIFGEHDLGARAPVPADRSHPVPQRPHLLQSRRCSGRRSRRSASRSATTGASSWDRPRPSRRCPPVRRGPRPAADLPTSRRAAAAAARAGPSRSDRYRDPRGTPRARRSGRPAGTSQLAADSTEGRRGAAARPGARRRRRRRPLLHHPDQHGGPADARHPRRSRSTRTSSISPSRCRRPLVRTAIDAAIGGKTTKTVHEVEATDVSATGPRFIETIVRPYVREAGRVEGAIIELSDVSRSEHDRLASARSRAPSSSGRRSSTGGCSTPTTS